MEVSLKKLLVQRLISWSKVKELESLGLKSVFHDILESDVLEDYLGNDTLSTIRRYCINKALKGGNQTYSSLRIKIRKHPKGFIGTIKGGDNKLKFLVTKKTIYINKNINDSIKDRVIEVIKSVVRKKTTHPKWNSIPNNTTPYNSNMN
jgi:hypothetical protein